MNTLECGFGLFNVQIILRLPTEGDDLMTTCDFPFGLFPTGDVPNQSRFPVMTPNFPPQNCFDLSLSWSCCHGKSLPDWVYVHPPANEATSDVTLAGTVARHHCCMSVIADTVGNICLFGPHPAELILHPRGWVIQVLAIRLLRIQAIEYTGCRTGW
jgi:hypothetical protein